MADRAPQPSMLRELPDADLQDQLKKLRDELWQHRLKAGTGSLQHTHVLTATRRQIARLHTAIRERQRQGAPQKASR